MMKRLTERREKASLNSQYCHKKGIYTADCIEKLGAYEDAEEQGLLLRLPCKAGNMVYILEPCHCYNNYKENQNCHHSRTRATKFIDIVRVPTERHTRCVKLFEKPFKMDYFTRIGKTVFLTRAEAEQALERMKGE